MDLDIKGRDEPGDTDKMNRLENPSQRRQSLVESLDMTAFSVPSNVKYQYDYWATLCRRGLSTKERMDRFYEDDNRPPLPASSNHTLRALAFQVTKESERTTDHAKRDVTMSSHNSNFCKPCRRIFDGNGSFVLPMTKSEKGLYYTHWDTRMLKRSARNCPLCFQVDRAIGTPIASRELIPTHYDIVGFVKAKGLYATRFSCYVMVVDGKKIDPYVASQAMITMDTADSK